MKNAGLLLLVLCLLSACAAGTPKEETACHRIGEAFHSLALNKDLGLTQDDQIAMVRKDSENPEAAQYMLGILEIIYRYPKLSASGIREEFLAHCSVNEAGQLVPQRGWNPWTPSQPEWQYKGTQNFEQKHAGGGAGKRYESSIGWVDVYFFSAGRTNWLEGTVDPGFSGVFEAAGREILEAAKQGHYRNVSIEKTSNIVIAGHTFRHAVARYEFDGRKIESHTLMTALNGQLLKYRMSFPERVPPDLHYVIRTFVEQTSKEYARP